MVHEYPGFNVPVGQAHGLGISQGSQQQKLLRNSSAMPVNPPKGCKRKFAIKIEFWQKRPRYWYCQKSSKPCTARTRTARTTDTADRTYKAFKRL